MESPTRTQPVAGRLAIYLCTSAATVLDWAAQQQRGFHPVADVRDQEAFECTVVTFAHQFSRYALMQRHQTAVRSSEVFQWLPGVAGNHGILGLQSIAMRRQFTRTRDLLSHVPCDRALSWQAVCSPSRRHAPSMQLLDGQHPE